MKQWENKQILKNYTNKIKNARSSLKSVNKSRTNQINTVEDSPKLEKIYSNIDIPLSEYPLYKILKMFDLQQYTKVI